MVLCYLQNMAVPLFAVAQRAVPYGANICIALCIFSVRGRWASEWRGEQLHSGWWGGGSAQAISHTLVVDM